MLSVSAMTRNRFFPADAVHLARSQAKCEAVEEDPPLPAMYTVAELCQASNRRSIAAEISCRGISSITAAIVPKYSSM